jgi:hypothetical protein
VRSSSNCPISTGKRRYGHPALLGVLPEPWLPLKKGQTLVSGIGNGSSRTQKKDSDQAVVLTLRKRYSTVRRNVRQMTTGMMPEERHYADDEQNDGGVQELATPESTSNPWHDSRPGPSRRSQTAPQPLHHRLSFDHASGVIMLPEGESWLVDGDDSDSEDDYGSPSPNGETAPPAVDSSLSGVAGSLPDTSVPTPSKRRSLYSTYYHHPERRSRQTVPGAFDPQGD